jgi:hypothetical protein
MGSLQNISISVRERAVGIHDGVELDEGNNDVLEISSYAASMVSACSHCGEESHSLGS